MIVLVVVIIVVRIVRGAIALAGAKEPPGRRLVVLCVEVRCYIPCVNTVVAVI